jgi:acyl carrier protein
MKDHRIQERVVSTASAVFSMPAEVVAESRSLQEIPTWDSIVHLNFVLALEQEFGCTFSEQEIEELLSISSIVAVIGAKELQ